MAAQQWEYITVSFENEQGWYKPKFVNGEAPEKGWEKGPYLEEYVNRLGASGWEMIGVVPGMQFLSPFILFFKRPKV